MSNRVMIFENRRELDKLFLQDLCLDDSEGSMDTVPLPNVSGAILKKARFRAFQ